MLTTSNSTELREPRTTAARSSMRTAPSLKPDEAVMNAFVVGQPEAVEIVKSWRFNYPTRTVSRQEFEKLTERTRVVFNG